MAFWFVWFLTFCSYPPPSLVIICPAPISFTHLCLISSHCWVWIYISAFSLSAVKLSVSIPHALLFGANDLLFLEYFARLWLLHLRPLANLGQKSSQFFHIFAFLAIYRCLLQTFYHINQAELEIKGQVYRFSTIITFCPEWPWNWTHTTTTLCASVLLYAWRSLDKMKRRHGMTVVHAYYSNCELSLHSSSITCSADVVPIRPHSPRLSI